MHIFQDFAAAARESVDWNVRWRIEWYELQERNATVSAMELELMADEDILSSEVNVVWR